jgi:hypothetical protein
MPYLVKIGAIQTNKSGVGSRGYHIYRRSQTLVTVWGRVEVRPRERDFTGQARPNIRIFRAELWRRHEND